MQGNCLSSLRSLLLFHSKYQISEMIPTTESSTKVEVELM